MSFYLIGTAFPGFLSPLVLYAFDLFVLFLHLTFEQNSVICPPQGSLQRFFRGGGLSPPAKVKVGNSLHPMQNSRAGQKSGPQAAKNFQASSGKSGKQSKDKFQQT